MLEGSPEPVESAGPPEDNKGEPVEEGEEPEKDQPKEENEDMMQSAAVSPALQNIIDEIKKKYEETGELFEDPDFPATDVSLYIDPVNPPEYAKDIAFVEWKRPQEISNNAQFVIDGMTPGDVIQGILGDCWLLGSFCCMATRAELLNDLVAYNGMEYGVAIFQFFKNGVWQPVIVDTRLPYDPKSKKLLYARCERDDEFWVCLLEKAYAKLYKNYQMLDGGKMQDSLVDLTGGIAEKINLKDILTGDSQLQTAKIQELWKAMKINFSSGYVMGCSFNDKNAKTTMSTEGIVINHAYGIISVREIQTLKLIRLRNPWGKGEWRGPFSDDDDHWDNHKGLREALGHELKDDGVFWMEFKDWYANFNKLYIAKIFSIAWQQYSIPCAWKGKTNGGRNFSFYYSSTIRNPRR